MALNERMIAIIAACIMLATCILYIVSNVLNQWGFKNSRHESAILGLWRRCESSGGVTTCVNLALKCSGIILRSLSTCNKIMVSRAFITIACIVSIYSALCLFICGIISTISNRIVILISKILPSISFIAGLIGVVVGIVAISTSPVDYELGLAGIIAITATSLNMIGALSALATR